MAHDMRFFMKKSNENEIVKVKGLERFTDNEGNIIPFEIKKLSRAERRKINRAYTNRKIAIGENKRPIVENGELVHDTESDHTRAFMHLIVESLQFPNLKDSETMKFYNCVDITEMPEKVFSEAGELDYVSEVIGAVYGFSDKSISDYTVDRLIEEAKN